MSSSAPTLDSLRARYGPRYKWLALSVVMVGAVASILSSTIVNVALPHLSAEFRVGIERAQWVGSVHMAATTVSMLAVPWLLGRFGFRRTFFAAMALLFAGSAGGGLAPSFEWLVGARVLQGIASGLAQPLSMVLILRAFDEHEQGRASGIFGFGVVLAPAVGPVVGGLLTDAIGWRAVFWIGLPFALLAAAMARALLPRMPQAPDERPFDWRGMALLATFVPSLLVFFVQLHDHGLSMVTFGWLAATALACVALVAWERAADAPLVDLRVFRFGDFRRGTVVAFIYGAGLFGSTLLVPLFVQHSLHYSAAQSGVLLLPAGVALALTIPIAGRLSDKLAPRLLVGSGLLAFGVSFALMAAFPLAGFAALALMLILGRIGLGLVLPSLSLATVRRVDPEYTSQAASLFNFTRMLGGAAGTSAVAIFVEARAKQMAGATLTTAHVLVPQWAELRAYREGFAVLAVLFALAAVVAARLQGKRAA